VTIADPAANMHDACAQQLCRADSSSRDAQNSMTGDEQNTDYVLQ
jgi:hypothetical protein